MIVLHIAPRSAPVGALTDIRLLAKRYPGAHELQIKVGERSLHVGAEWRYSACGACLSALGEFGQVEVAVEC